ncbi:Mu transposase C-terminal domain-containing protein [Rhizobium giardinii]|uniref:Mu transposase C-terminal domain-containing protein n=1 Tax=Rhizobium giardinii TaxID=56731 RepID=UPI003D6F36FD
MTAHAISIENVTPIFRFEPSDGGRLGDKYYKWVRTTQNHQVFRRADTGIEESFTHETLAALLGDKVRPFEHLPRFYGEGPIDCDSGNLFLGDLPEARQTKTDFKITVVEKFLSMEAESIRQKVSRKDRVTRSDAKMKVALEEIAKEMGKDAVGGKNWSTYTTKRKRGGLEMPHPRTVREWILAYEQDNNPLNLVETRGGFRGNSYFAAEEATVLDSFVRQYASIDKPTMVSLHEKMKAFVEGLNEARRQNGDESHEPLRVPSLRTFQNRINALNQSFVELGREGKDKTSARHRPIGAGMSVKRALQRVEMDEWRVDWRTLLTIMGIWQKLTKEQRKKVPRERLFITAAIDYASKSLLALRVHREAPSIMTVLATLEMVCIDKSDIAARYGCRELWRECGTPETCAADSAAWYAKQAFRVTLNDLGTKVFLPPAGAASARGTIERFFRTSSGKALESFSGRTFGSIAARGDYDSDALANLPFDEIAACLTRFYVDVYQNTPHEALNGETPREAWKRLTRTHRLRPPPTGRRRRHIFGINVYRTLGRHGVRFLGVPYQSAALQALFRRRKQRVLIRVDRFDLGEISVWNGEGWTSVPAVTDDFKGMSVWTWRALCIGLRKLNLKKAQVSSANLRKAKADLDAKAEILRLEAGLDSPILSDEKFRAWDREMDRCVEVVKDHGNVPGNFVEKLVFAPEFYRELGIEFVPPTEEDEDGPDPEKGWIDPLGQDVQVAIAAHTSAVERASRFDR